MENIHREKLGSVHETIKAAQHMLEVLDDEYPAIKLQHLTRLYETKESIMILGRFSAKDKNAKVMHSGRDPSALHMVRQFVTVLSPCSARVLTWQEVFGKPDMIDVNKT